MEHIIDKQKMNALKALSDLNLKVSEARALLTELEETETEYLAGREKKAMDRINKVLADSEELIAQTSANYDEIMRFYALVSSFAEFLKAAHTNFKETLVLFDERNALWEAKIERQEAEIAQMRKTVFVDRTKLDNEKKSLEKERKNIENATRKLDSDRGTVERAIARLKDKRT